MKMTAKNVQLNKKTFIFVDKVILL